MHQRALARTRRAHDRREAVGRQADGDTVEGTDFGAAAAIDLDGGFGTGGEGGRLGPTGHLLGLGGIGRGHEFKRDETPARTQWSGQASRHGGRPARQRGLPLPHPANWGRSGDSSGFCGFDRRTGKRAGSGSGAECPRAWRCSVIEVTRKRWVCRGRLGPLHTQRSSCLPAPANRWVCRGRFGPSGTHRLLHEHGCPDRRLKIRAPGATPAARPLFRAVQP